MNWHYLIELFREFWGTQYNKVVKSIQRWKNHQRRIFLDNYYRQRWLV
jgi:hypothetical protein